MATEETLCPRRGGCVIALIVLAILLEAELAFAIIAVLALAAYAWDRLN